MGGDGAAADMLRGEFDHKNMQLFCTEANVDIVLPEDNRRIIEFFGDSITNLMEPLTYYQKFGACINRGISGDSVHIMNRRFEADVLQLNPKLCVMLGGVNNTWCLDEFVNEEGQAPEEKIVEVYELVERSYIEILESAKAADLNMVLCSVLPVAAPVPFADMRNLVIVGINKIINRLCETYDVTYCDYHSALVKEDGLTLRDGLADDGLHPHYKGYVIMASVLTPLLEELL